jgi:5-methylthioadenosine/S-adenosylhomocysteine deaminase
MARGEQLTKTLIRGASVLTMDEHLGDLESGDVLIDGGIIVAVGRDLPADGAEIIDGSGMIAMPGLVDTHNHLWQTPVRGLGSDCWGGEYFATIHPVSQYVTPEDLFTATRAGSVELMAHGVTTVFDFCHSIHSPEHADASLDAFDDTGIRAIYGYSMRDRPELETRTLRSTEDRMRDAARVHGSRMGDSSRVRLSVAMNNIDHVPATQNEAEVRFGRELGVQLTVHSILAGNITTLASLDLLGPDIQWVHATGASDAEVAMLAAEGGSLSVTPESEAMVMGQWPITSRALRAGIPVGLGIDLPSAFSGSIANQVRAAVTIDRLLHAHERRVQGHGPARDGVAQPLSARRALELATSEAAASVGLGDVTGSLTPGKAADVVLLKIPPFMRPGADLATHVAIQTSRGDVHTVFVDGVVRVRDGQPVGVDLDRLADDLTRAHGNLTRNKRGS